MKGQSHHVSASPTQPLSLWAVPVADMGGVARHVIDVVRSGLPGLRMAVLCPPGPLADTLRQLEASVVVGAFGTRAGVVRSVRQLRRTVAQLQPAVVHTHLAYADVVAAIAMAMNPRVRLISTEHGIADDSLMYHATPWRSQVMVMVHRARLRRCDALIAVSEATRHVMSTRWRPRQPIHVIHNAVDPVTRPSRTRGENLRILSLSRLAPEKRIDVLLRAMPLVLDQVPDATLTVAGTGDQEQTLRVLANRLGVEDVVHFVGFLDAQEAMAQHDVVVQLSAWENLSYTLLDARAAGMAVVATDVGGNREILPAESLLTDLSPVSVAEAIVAAQPVPSTTTRLNAQTDAATVADMASAIAAVTLETVTTGQGAAA